MVLGFRVQGPAVADRAQRWFRVQGRRSHTRLVFKKQSGSISRVSALSRDRESVLHLQFTGPNPLDHRDD